MFTQNCTAAIFINDGEGLKTISANDNNALVAANDNEFVAVRAAA